MWRTWGKTEARDSGKGRGRGPSKRKSQYAQKDRYTFGKGPNQQKGLLQNFKGKVYIQSFTP